MDLVFISDTHNLHKRITEYLPSGDVIIHSGDVTNTGTILEIISFLSWFGSLPYKHKIFIAGNHDFYFQNISKDNLENIIPNNVHYLYNSSILIDGIKFWGSPDQPIFCNWAFNKTKEELKKTWSKIPENTDVLITHCPPNKILDKTLDGYNVGCKALRNKIDNIKPKINVFGHIHEAYGIEKINGTTFINSSVVDKNYRLVNKVITIKL